MRELHARRWWPALLATLLLTVGLGAPGDAAGKPRVVLVVPFDATGVDREQQWLGEGVAQVLALGFAQTPAFVQIDRARLRAVGRPEAWGEAAVARTARALRADAALFGRIAQGPEGLAVEPHLLEVHGAATDATVLDAVPLPEGEVLTRLATLPEMYAHALKVSLSDADRARVAKAAAPTRSVRAFALYARAVTAAQRDAQDARETAVELLSRAIEIDPGFVVAQYTLGTVHQALGNRWKAAAQYRAATQLDATYPEPFKALGDLFLAAPRRLFDQAVEAYSKAIELRPFYADAYVGLGDARAAKGEVDAAVTAYQKALVYNPTSPRVYVSLGKIYYSEKGLYYESVNAYKRALELDPASTEARMGLGDVYEDKGLYKEALEQYRRVIETDPKNTGALYNLALVYEKIDPREAIAEWERYIDLASQLPSEKDWVDVARQHLRKLRGQHKE